MADDGKRGFEHGLIASRLLWAVNVSPPVLAAIEPGATDGPADETARLRRCPAGPVERIATVDQSAG